MNKEECIKAVFIQPGEKPKIVEIENSLRGYYSLVGEPIQAVYPFEDDAALICNDEGKLNGLPLNRAILDRNGKVSDIIAGNMIICRAPVGSEDFASLTPAQARKYCDRFRRPEIFMKTPDGIMVTRLNLVSLRKKDKEIER